MALAMRKACAAPVRRQAFTAVRPAPRRAMVCRAGAVDEVMAKLKTMTLLEAAELVAQIETTFGVSAVAAAGPAVVMAGGAAPAAAAAPAAEEKTTFDIVLEDIPADKKVAVYKVVRAIANIAVNQVKDFTATMPKVLKEGMSKAEAADAKAQLEAAGAKCKIA